MGHTGSGIEISPKCTPDGTLSSHHSNSYIYLDFHIIFLVCKSFIYHLYVFCLNSLLIILFASATTLLVSVSHYFCVFSTLFLSTPALQSFCSLRLDLCMHSYKKLRACRVYRQECQDAEIEKAALFLLFLDIMTLFGQKS